MPSRISLRELPKRLGTIGDISAYSLQINKLITAGERCAIVTGNEPVGCTIDSGQDSGSVKETVYDKKCKSPKLHDRSRGERNGSRVTQSPSRKRQACTVGRQEHPQQAVPLVAGSRRDRREGRRCGSAQRALGPLPRGECGPLRREISRSDRSEILRRHQ